MNRHQIKRFIRYRLEAKTRHGVHSPFVFDFIEKGLRKNDRLSLLQKITGYFRASPLVTIEDLAGETPETLNALLDNSDPEAIVLITSIHRDAHNSLIWKSLTEQPQVTLSMDLYNYGLLFFRKEFLVKQHFVIKYPA